MGANFALKVSQASLQVVKTGAPVVLEQKPCWHKVLGRQRLATRRWKIFIHLILWQRFPVKIVGQHKEFFVRDFITMSLRLRGREGLAVALQLGREPCAPMR